MLCRGVVALDGVDVAPAVGGTGAVDVFTAAEVLACDVGEGLVVCAEEVDVNQAAVVASVVVDAFVVASVVAAVVAPDIAAVVAAVDAFVVAAVVAAVTVAVAVVVATVAEAMGLVDGACVAVLEVDNVEELDEAVGIIADVTDDPELVAVEED